MDKTLNTSNALAYAVICRTKANWL